MGTRAGTREQPEEQPRTQHARHDNAAWRWFPGTVCAVKAAVSEAEARFDAMRKRVGLVASPFVFLAMWFAPLDLPYPAHALAAVAATTVVLWVTEAIPLAATALAAPGVAAMLGVASPEKAFAAFGDPLMFLFIGGFMLATALSVHGFDRRAALWLISRKIVGGSTSRAVIVVIVIGFAFSMWISNTATMAMLLPVVMGLYATIRNVVGDDPDTLRKMDRYGGGMCLALAYAASLGGAGTPIGTAPNVIAIGMLENSVGVKIDFLEWMTFALPFSILGAIALAILILYRFPAPVKRVEGLADEVARQLAELGAMKRAEKIAVGVFALAIFGWLLPSLLRLALGEDHVWTVFTDEYFAEGVVAIACALLLFCLGTGESDAEGEPKRVLTWEDAHSMDWGTMFLLGGGLALGRMTFETGLAEALGRGVLDIAGPIAAHPLGLTAASALLVVGITELTSNTATTSMMLPVVIGIATEAGFDPTPTAVTVTLASSCAFMLPVSTPPNAMAYGTRLIRLDAMFRTGFWLDVVTYGLLLGFAAVVLPMLF
jgi:sodium-dependent dicarboxylate transporter 2/3/5